jgi:hypothetical protein
MQMEHTVIRTIDIERKGKNAYFKDRMDADED